MVSVGCKDILNFPFLPFCHSGSCCLICWLLHKTGHFLLKSNSFLFVICKRTAKLLPALGPSALLIQISMLGKWQSPHSLSYTDRVFTRRYSQSLRCCFAVFETSPVLVSQLVSSYSIGVRASIFFSPDNGS